MIACTQKLRTKILNTLHSLIYAKVLMLNSTAILVSVAPNTVTVAGQLRMPTLSIEVKLISSGFLSAHTSRLADMWECACLGNSSHFIGYRGAVGMMSQARSPPFHHYHHHILW